MLSGVKLQSCDKFVWYDENPQKKEKVATYDNGKKIANSSRRPKVHFFENKTSVKCQVND